MKPAIYDEKNYKKYFYGCREIIARGNERELNDLLYEIQGSVEDIIKSCKKYDRDLAYIIEHDNKPYYVSEQTRYSLALLDLFSDHKFCRFMVLNNPDTAILIFNNITRYKMYRSGGYSLVKQIIMEAFINQESILYREQDFVGLGNWGDFTNNVFGDDELNNSFNSFSAWNYWQDDNIQPYKVEKYGKVAITGINAYFLRGRFWEHSFSLNNIFSVLHGIALDQVVQVDKLSRDETSNSKPYKNLSEIKEILCEIVKNIQTNQLKLPDYPFDENSYDLFKDSSIYKFVAEGIFEFYEILSQIELQDDRARALAIRIWLEVFPVSNELENPAVINIQKRLQFLLLKRAEKNLKETLYPIVTKLLISILGLYEKEVGDEPRGEIKFRSEFFSLLREEFETAISNDHTRAKLFIPSNVQYSYRRGTLTQTVFNEKREFALREPKLI